MLWSRLLQVSNHRFGVALWSQFIFYTLILHVFSSCTFLHLAFHPKECLWRFWCHPMHWQLPEGSLKSEHHVSSCDPYLLRWDYPLYYLTALSRRATEPQRRVNNGRISFQDKQTKHITDCVWSSISMKKEGNQWYMHLLFNCMPGARTTVKWEWQCTQYLPSVLSLHTGRITQSC